MAFKKNNRASPGRPPGAKNKKTDLFAICAELGIDVFREMVTLAAHEIDKEKRFEKLQAVAPYLYAKKKEVLNLSDHTAEELLAAAEDKIVNEPEAV